MTRVRSRPPCKLPLVISRCAPRLLQPQDFIAKVVEAHKKNRGLTPGHCDRRFLDVAYRLPLYGIDLHTVMVSTHTHTHTHSQTTAACLTAHSECDSVVLMFSFQDYMGIPLYLGVSGNGVTVFCGELPQLVQLNNFPW